MSERRFKKGDRVSHSTNGDGTIVRISNGTPPILVDFDTWVNGHDGDGLCKHNHGWWTFHHELKIIDATNSTPPRDSYDPADICPHGGGHMLVLDATAIGKSRVYYEILRCSACGYVSTGWKK